MQRTICEHEKMCDAPELPVRKRSALDHCKEEWETPDCTARLSAGYSRVRGCGTSEAVRVVGPPPVNAIATIAVHGFRVRLNFSRDSIVACGNVVLSGLKMMRENNHRTHVASPETQAGLSENYLQILRSESGLPRIAMISTHGYVAAQPPLGAADTGGQVVYVLELSKKMAQLGYEVDIWTRQFEDQPAIEPVAEQVRIIRAPCGGRNFISKEYLYEKIPQWSENALRFIQKHHLKYEFINSHYWDAGVAGQHLSDVLGVPHVHTPHSLGVWKKKQMEADYPGDSVKFEARYNFEARIHHETLLYATADVVLATTPPQLDLLVKDYEVPREKCRMIPPGYDDNRFFPVGEASRNAIRNRLGFSGQVIMAIGRLARNKGYDLLIQAFQLVADRNPDAILYLAIGSSTLTPLEQTILTELQQLTARLGLIERVRFAHFIPDEEMADYYRAADVFVLSSRYEPFGMTAIEAMACGTPTVVTVHGGLYRALTFGRHALYADPFDREDLGVMILKILKHQRVRARLARMGSHKARSLFTWTGVAQQLIALVENRSTGHFAVNTQEWGEPWNDAD